jgi:hypothetical protein
MDKLHTWVRYRDESWYIGKFENDKSELWDALDTTTEYADDKEITVLTELPIFKLGDTVISIDSQSRLYKKISKIKRIMKSGYYHYQIVDINDDSITDRMTPFQIRLIDY